MTAPESQAEFEAESEADGERVLDALVTWFGRYIKTSQPEDLWLLALWAAHTHVIEQVHTTPRLLVGSPLPGAGKTTVLEHLGALCGGRPVMASNALTPPVVARVAGQGRPLLIDEADKHLASGSADQRALLGVVNTGYRRGMGGYLVNEQQPDGTWAPVEIPVFAPVAMAGISPDLPDDVMSRTIRITLLPDRHGTVAESDWELIRPEADALRDKLARWGERASLEPGESLPESLTGRMREVYRPLKRVANVEAGVWPERVDRLAQRHAEAVALDQQAGMQAERPHVILVRDIYGVWHISDPEGVGFAATDDLLRELHTHAPEVWGARQQSRSPLTAQRLGHMLTKAYGISAQRPMIGGVRRGGYYSAQFEPAWGAIFGEDLDGEPFVMAAADSEQALANAPSFD